MENKTYTFFKISWLPITAFYRKFGICDYLIVTHLSDLKAQDGLKICFPPTGNTEETIKVI